MVKLFSLKQLTAGIVSIYVVSVAQALPLSLIQLPPGFTISIYAKDITAARQMSLGKNGVVFVGTGSGKVYALLPDKNFTKAKQVVVIARDHRFLNGVAYHHNDLYVAGIPVIYRFTNINQHLSNPGKPQVITDKLPDKSWHGLHYLKFGPDGWLYTGVGVPCNSCLLKDQRFGTIMRMKPDGSDLQIYAKGIRNTVGFAWNPKTKILWFTDNGQDYLGDNTPPDELNRAPAQGLNFGFPYFYGDNVPAPKYGHLRSSQGMVKPAYNLSAHVAALGMTFYTGHSFPEKYHNQIFIAEHGSWNRSKKIGYRVMVAKLQDDKVVSVKPFATGWLQGQHDWGRPVDVLVMPDGALLVSDDKKGVIYRISYHP